MVKKYCQCSSVGDYAEKNLITLPNSTCVYVEDMYYVLEVENKGNGLIYRVGIDKQFLEQVVGEVSTKKNNLKDGVLLLSSGG